MSKETNKHFEIELVDVEGCSWLWVKLFWCYSFVQIRGMAHHRNDWNRFNHVHRTFIVQNDCHLLITCSLLLSQPSMHSISIVIPILRSILPLWLSRHRFCGHPSYSFFLSISNTAGFKAGCFANADTEGPPLKLLDHMTPPPNFDNTSLTSILQM